MEDADALNAVHEELQRMEKRQAAAQQVAEECLQQCAFGTAAMKACIDFWFRNSRVHALGLNWNGNALSLEMLGEYLSCCTSVLKFANMVNGTEEGSIMITCSEHWRGATSSQNDQVFHLSFAGKATDKELAAQKRSKAESASPAPAPDHERTDQGDDLGSVRAHLTLQEEERKVQQYCKGAMQRVVEIIMQCDVRADAFTRCLVTWLQFANVHVLFPFWVDCTLNLCVQEGYAGQSTDAINKLMGLISNSPAMAPYVLEHTRCPYGTCGTHEKYTLTFSG
eukprot:m.324339 g.324339  ORF g.324339 m.324339 type:complete len:281 (+) comp32849_c0_seq1:194-1036(+)